MASQVDSSRRPSLPPGAGSRLSVPVFRWTVIGLSLAALWTMHPLWAPVLLAAWTAILAQPLHNRMMRLGGRTRAAGLLTVAFVVLAIAPLVVVGLSLFGTAVDLVHSLERSSGGKDAFNVLLSSERSAGIASNPLQRGFELMRQHGASAMRAASTVFGAATAVVIGLFVFLCGFFAFLTEGNRAKSWIISHSPLPREHMLRFGAAFVETGRGLFIGVGVTALLQGVLATVGYVVIGVPQALVLGLLTTLAALIPSIGTGLVWVPVTVALFLSGRNGAGVALLVVGCVVSVADNIIRPWLSRYGHLQLPTFVVLVSMLGGIGVFGPWGVLLGPLLVRLAVEALAIWQDEQGVAPRRRSRPSVSGVGSSPLSERQAHSSHA
jgi:predicted PurR-regulated permease PerM